MRCLKKDGLPSLICQIFQAIVLEDEDELREKLAKGVDLGSTFRGMTPLSFAVYRGHAPSVGILLEAGAPVDKRSKDHLERVESPLITSIRLGHYEIFRQIINFEADVNLPNFYGHSPLLCAVEERNYRAIKLLLRLGANITFNKYIKSPLNFVAEFLGYQGRRDICIELVAAGLQLDLKDCYGRTPLSMALLHKDLSMCTLLVEAGARFRPPREHPTSPMQLNIHSVPNHWLEDEDISAWIQEESDQNVPPLLRLCRVRIRNYLRLVHNREVRPLIKKLPLPDPLIQYLLLKASLRLAIEGLPKLESEDSSA